jgi:hypothetical protein
MLQILGHLVNKLSILLSVNLNLFYPHFMKKLFLIVCVLLAASSTSFSQQAVPPIAKEQSTAAPVVEAAAHPVPDSVRQALHKLFKRGRLFSSLSAISGGVFVGGATSYIIRDEDDWRTGVDLALGANALIMGVSGMVHFSRRRERKLLETLEKGQPLPPYYTYWMPLLTPKSKKKERLN